MQTLLCQDSEKAHHINQEPLGKWVSSRLLQRACKSSSDCFRFRGHEIIDQHFCLLLRNQAITTLHQATVSQTQDSIIG